MSVSLLLGAASLQAGEASDTNHSYKVSKITFIDDFWTVSGRDREVTIFSSIPMG
jgi:hypothetical protein